MFASAEDGVLVDIISHILLTYRYSVVCAIIKIYDTQDKYLTPHTIYRI
jgi:hypothetical protein